MIIVTNLHLIPDIIDKLCRNAMLPHNETLMSVRLDVMCLTKSQAKKSKLPRQGMHHDCVPVCVHASIRLFFNDYHVHSPEPFSALANQRLAEFAIIHTTMGDIHVKLFPKEACFSAHLVKSYCFRPQKPWRTSPCIAAIGTNGAGVYMWLFMKLKKI